MKKAISLLLLVAAIVIPMAVAEEINSIQIKEFMMKSIGNITSYSIDYRGDTIYQYSNGTYNETIEIVDTSSGAVNVSAVTGRLLSKSVSTKSPTEIYMYYAINDTVYTNETGNWTKDTFSDPVLALEQINEARGQINLIMVSPLNLTGNATVQGEDCYVLSGPLTGAIEANYVVNELAWAAYYCPIPLPNRTILAAGLSSNNSFDQNANVNATAWISKKTGYPRALNIMIDWIGSNEIMNITSEPPFKVVGTYNETTIFGDFGAPVNVVLPEGALNAVEEPLWNISDQGEEGCPSCGKEA
jgi:hypothetical protein